MSSGYSLSPSQARVCRVAAWLFLLAALLEVGSLLFSVFAADTQFRCAAGGACGFTSRPELLLPDEQRALVEASPEARARLAAHVGRPSVRLGLAVVGLLDNLPVVALLSSVAMALGRLGGRLGRRGDLGGALPWLRRAAIAAVLMAVLTPVAESARVMLVLRGVEPAWWFALDVKPFMTNLLLALAAFAVTWALAAGSRAERDMAEIV